MNEIQNDRTNSEAMDSAALDDCEPIVIAGAQLISTSPPEVGRGSIRDSIQSSALEFEEAVNTEVLSTNTAPSNYISGAKAA